MANVVILYGSTYGNTAEAAETIAQTLFDGYNVDISMENVDDADLSGLEDFDLMLLGCSTWHDGKLQDSWEYKFDELDKLNLNGKRVALFGAGDQRGYDETFQDALGILGRKLRERGAQLVGFTGTAGYDFTNSAGVENGQFMGLALDFDNQPELNASRIQAWVKQIATEFQLNRKAVTA
jgi:flavodoxin I